MLALSRDDVKRLVPMADAIELVKIAFKELSANRAVAPLRSVIDVEKDRSSTLLMPAFVPAASALGFKVVSVFPGNLERGLPTITAMVCLLNHETGEPIAIMNGAYLTALRTGAVSGAATELLAREESHRLVVFGAGPQGVTQAAAVCAVRPIERITVVDLSEEALARFHEAVGRDWPEIADRVETTTNGGAAVAEADVICTATTARRPVFSDADVRPGTHINAIGGFTPVMQEVPAETVARSTVVVDQIEAALEEAGDLIIPLNDGLIDRSHVRRELGEIIAGDAPRRATPEEITLFKTVGNAVQDVTVARHAVEAAWREGAGQQIDLG